MTIRDASASTQSIEAFLNPVKLDRFLKEFYFRAPLHIPGAPDKFAHLLSWDGLNRATTLQRRYRPPLRLAKDGRVLPQQQFSTKVSNPNGEFWSVNFRAVRKLLQEGATLLIDRIDETHEPIADCCRMLEAELGSEAWADTFASWQQTQGFSTHWDVEEVFIAQVVGRKHWRVFKPSVLHPTKHDKNSPRDILPSEPYWEGDLNPGDILYIPAGWWHDALAMSGRTLHVALSLYPDTGLDVLNAMLPELRENELVRSPLPRFATEDEQQDYMTRLRKVVHDKLLGVTVKSALEKRDARAPARTRLSMPWSAPSRTEEIPGDAWIHWLAPRRITVTQAGEEIRFDAIGEQFRFVAMVLPVIQDLMERRKTTFEELCSRHPQLPVETILLQLVDVGLVAIAEDSIV
jgi:ribosomal protein L16 Arg81 hydroxylase